jgi:MoxR-like ATPase
MRGFIMKNLTSEQSRLVETARERFGAVVTKQQIVDLANELGAKRPRFIWDAKENRVGRGKYALPGSEVAMQNVAQVVEIPTPVQRPAPVVQTPTTLSMYAENYVPQRDPLYVPFGFFKDMRNILESRMFYPVMVTGLSGNGKTMMVEQACAAAKREMVKVSISIETDEDDLIGGNTLVDGNVVFREGPVLTAMRKGAVLVLDEIDRGSNKLLCMQAIAEGKPYINKKTGEIVNPAPGFQIVATANTKGKGSDDGRFIAAQILDEAFLERFPVTVEQEYAPVVTEKKILKKVFADLELNDEEFADKLVDWADIIRKTYYDGGVDEIIATRRLVHIAKAYSIFKDRMKAIEMCVNRFDAETKESFMDLYTKVDADAVVTDEEGEPVVAPSQEDYTPF